MVSAKTRAKVMEAAQQLDFSVSRMAGILKSGRSHRVALLVGSSKLDWFTSRIIEGLNEVLRSAGYDLVIQPIGDAGAREEFFDELPVRGNAGLLCVRPFKHRVGSHVDALIKHLPFTLSEEQQLAVDQILEVICDFCAVNQLVSRF